LEELTAPPVVILGSVTCRIGKEIYSYLSRDSDLAGNLDYIH